MASKCRHNNVELSQYMVTNHRQQGANLIPAMAQDNAPVYAETKLLCKDCKSYITEMELLLAMHWEIQYLKSKFVRTPPSIGTGTG